MKPTLTSFVRNIYNESNLDELMENLISLIDSYEWSNQVKLFFVDPYGYEPTSTIVLCPLETKQHMELFFKS